MAGSVRKTNKRNNVQLDIDEAPPIDQGPAASKRCKIKLEPGSPSSGCASAAQYSTRAADIEQDLKIIDSILAVLSMRRTEILYNEVNADQVIMIAMRMDAYNLGTMPGVAQLDAARERLLKRPDVDTEALDITLLTIRERLFNLFRDWSRFADTHDADEFGDDAIPKIEKSAKIEASARNDESVPGNAVNKSPPREELIPSQDGTVEVPVMQRSSLRAAPFASSTASKRGDSQLHRLKGSQRPWQLFLNVILDVLKTKSLKERRGDRNRQYRIQFTHRAKEVWKTMAPDAYAQWLDLASSTSMGKRECAANAHRLFREQGLMDRLVASIATLMAEEAKKVAA